MLHTFSWCPHEDNDDNSGYCTRTCVQHNIMERRLLCSGRTPRGAFFLSLTNQPPASIPVFLPSLFHSHRPTLFLLLKCTHPLSTPSAQRTLAKEEASSIFPSSYLSQPSTTLCTPKSKCILPHRSSFLPSITYYLHYSYTYCTSPAAI